MYKGNPGKWVGIVTSTHDSTRECRMNPRHQQRNTGPTKKEKRAAGKVTGSRPASGKPMLYYDTSNSELLSLVTTLRQDKTVTIPMPCTLAIERHMRDMIKQNVTHLPWDPRRHSCPGAGITTCRETPCTQWLLASRTPGTNLDAVITAHQGMIHEACYSKSTVKPPTRGHFSLTKPLNSERVDVRARHPLANPFAGRMDHASDAYKELAMNPHINSVTLLQNIADRYSVKLRQGIKLDARLFIETMRQMRMRAERATLHFTCIQQRDDPSETDTLIMLVNPSTPDSELPDYLKGEAMAAWRVTNVATASADAPSHSAEKSAPPQTWSQRCGAYEHSAPDDEGYRTVQKRGSEKGKAPENGQTPASASGAGGKRRVNLDAEGGDDKRRSQEREPLPPGLGAMPTGQPLPPTPAATPAETSAGMPVPTGPPRWVAAGGVGELEAAMGAVLPEDQGDVLMSENSHGPEWTDADADAAMNENSLTDAGKDLPPPSQAP